MDTLTYSAMFKETADLEKRYIPKMHWNVDGGTMWILHFGRSTPFTRSFPYHGTWASFRMSRRTWNWTNKIEGCVGLRYGYYCYSFHSAIKL